MSITVTIEELKAYESAMEAWYKDRMKSGEIVRVSEERFDDARMQQFKWRQALDEWIKENPVPKLIPSV